jgi:hypothetical protein
VVLVLRLAAAMQERHERRGAERTAAGEAGAGAGAEVVAAAATPAAGAEEAVAEEVARQRVAARKAAEVEEPSPAEREVAEVAASPDEAVAAPTREARGLRLPAPELPEGNTDTLFLTAVHLSRNAGKPS